MRYGRAATRHSKTGCTALLNPVESLQTPVGLQIVFEKRIHGRAMGTVVGIRPSECSSGLSPKGVMKREWGHKQGRGRE